MTRTPLPLAPLALLGLLVTGQCSPPEEHGAAAAAGEPVRLCLSGSLQGRLEPCGCASGQLGGLARRAFHLQQTKGYDLRIEGGDLVAGASELDFLKFYKIVEILFGGPRPYDVLGVGTTDLQLDFASWSTILAGMQAPVVASDLASDDPAWPARPFVDKEVRSGRVRIASFTMALPEALAAIQPPRVRLLPPAAAWQRALEGAEAASLRILLVHGDDQAARKLAGSLQPPPDLVVGVGDHHSEPPGRPETVGKVPVVFPGVRGRLLLDVSLVREASGPRVVDYQLVELKGSATKPGAMEDADVRAAILQHRHQVKEDGLLQAMAEQRPTATGTAYVGSASCRACHPKAFEVHAGSKHHRAFETLVQAEQGPRYGWPVTAYPDCVACHVVGYGEKSGFVDHQRTPQLAGVGCESCHGPASAHVDSPEGSPLGKVGDGAPSTVCTRCHDFEQSPDFDYGKRWEKLRHGKD